MTPTVQRYLPFAVVVLCALALLVIMAPGVDPEGDLKLAEAGDIVVFEDGRAKPLDSYARGQLYQISNRQEWRDESGHMQPALQWYLDVVTTSLIPRKQHYPSEKILGFRVASEELRRRLKLPDQSPTKLEQKPGERKSEIKTDYLYTFDDLYRTLDILGGLAKEAARRDRNDLSDLDTQALELASQVYIYRSEISPYETPHKVFRIENDQLLQFLLLEKRPGDYRYSLEEFSPRVPLLLREATEASKRGKASLNAYDTKLVELAKNVQHYIEMAEIRTESLLVVPPSGPGKHWRNFAEGGENSDFFRVLKGYAAIQRGDKDQREVKDAFNKTVADYREKQEKEMPGVAAKASFEAYYNHAEPFYQCIWLYGVALLLSCASWLFFTEPLRRTAFWLILLTLTLHTFALIARMYLLGRPLVFIHNLYGTAVFIGWLPAWVGFGSEYIFRNGIGAAVGSFIGFATSILAHNMAAGDTLEVVQAVLDTNFWLATHVTIVNSGYAATMFAGVLGIVLILRGVLSNSLDKALYRTIGQMMYGVFGFAILFSFVGTVLGGIWADQSWGRFWGWDPKENGALLIVIMNALILHARWSGLVQIRGMAVLAVLGNVIVLWSWFYVNMLGVGLHSYGVLENTGRLWVLSVMTSQIIIAGVGLIPMRFWRSYEALQAPERPLAAAAPRPTRRERPRDKGSTGVTPA